MRMPPKGVRRRGNTDVLRQVPLLQALHRTGRPVARGALVERRRALVRGAVLHGRAAARRHVHRPQSRPGAVRRERGGGASLFGQVIDALASIHLLDWRTELAGWEEPRDARRRDPVLGPDPGQGGRGRSGSRWGSAPATCCSSGCPPTLPVGLFHGDFQTSNVLFDARSSRRRARLGDLRARRPPARPRLAVHDERPARAGSTARRLTIVPPFDELVDRYSAAVGRVVTLDDVAWYRALSGYRFGVDQRPERHAPPHRQASRRGVGADRALGPALFGRAADLLQADVLRRTAPARCLASCARSAAERLCQAGAFGPDRPVGLLVRGRLAQLEERHVHTVEVMGSRPVSPTRHLAWHRGDQPTIRQQLRAQRA